MRTNVIVIFLFLSSFLGSCVSDRTRIENLSREIVNAIRDSDLTAFKDYMGVTNFKKNEENHIFYFKEAHYYMKKYTFNDKPNSLKIIPQDALYITKVSMLLFRGFDSSNGVKQAVLVLSFRPSTPYSRYSRFIDINIDENIDVEYRHRYLTNDTTMPKLELDSAAIEKMKEIPLFNQ